MKTRVVAYCRVSTDKEDQQNSFDSQRLYFEEFIKSNTNWEFIAIYADEGISGTNVEKRKDFKNMINDAKQKKFDLILTKEVTRFARNTVDSLKYTRELRKIGVGVIFILDNINTLDSDGELRLTIMSALAQDDSRRTSERVKWGQKRRMEQGVVFGRELLGYNLNNGVLTVNNEEAEVVKMIFHKYIYEGKGTHAIAKELFEQGRFTKRNQKRWSNTMILKVLKNEKYVGDLAQKKTYTPDYLDHKKKYNKGEEELVYKENHHEPIVSRDLWNQAQKEMARRSATADEKSKHSNRYWCSGKIICGECGSKFVSRTKNLKNGSQYKAWRCNQAAWFGSKKKDALGNDIGCSNQSINHKILGEIILLILKSIDSNKEQITSELISEIKLLKKPQELRSTERLHTKMTQIKQKKHKLIDSMIEGIISKEDLTSMNKNYDLEIENIKKEITSIEQYNLINESHADNLQIYVDRINSIMSEMKFETTEELCKKMVDKVVVYNNNVLEVFLTCIATQIKLTYESKGKNGDYQISINYI
jgi:site-specific DNA recombinase